MPNKTLNKEEVTHLNKEEATHAEESKINAPDQIQQLMAALQLDREINSGYSSDEAVERSNETKKFANLVLDHDKSDAEKRVSKRPASYQEQVEKRDTKRARHK